ncbi:MAG: hypothetical protein DME49_12485 [Verrucomicrobia bacterium]|nr:MAG: hypothetical protein DME49_12485 [Verrucomicrobiota bacterium]
MHASEATRNGCADSTTCENETGRLPLAISRSLCAIGWESAESVRRSRDFSTANVRRKFSNFKKSETQTFDPARRRN